MSARPSAATSSPIRRRLLAVLIGLLGLIALLVAPATIANAHQAPSNQVRLATARFHSIQLAERVGYTKFLDCMDDGVSKGMGQHYVNSALLMDDGVLDPRRPEAMVYDVSGRHPRLVAVEYIVPGPPDMTPPRLLEQTFTYLPSLGVWKLHYWIWRANPDGIFKDFSPSVPLCAGETGLAMHH